MKDPFQTEQTPFEILGLDATADKAAVEQAFKQAVLRRVPVGTAMWARTELLDEFKRTSWRVRLYDSRALQTLDPCPLDTPSAMLRENRGATATAWEKQFRSQFPDVAIAHCLALFWYSWANHEEGRCLKMAEAAARAGPIADAKITRSVLIRRASHAEGIECPSADFRQCSRTECPWGEDCRSPAPEPKEMWRRAIGYWCMVEASKPFWENMGGLNENRVRGLRHGIMDELKQRLLNLGRQYGQHLGGADAGVGDLAEVEGIGPKTIERLQQGGLATLRSVIEAGEDGLVALGLPAARARAILAYAQHKHISCDGLPRQYRALTIALERERRTAKAVAAANIRNSRGRVCCGIMMLRQVGWADRVRQVAEEKGLESLLQALSRHFAVTVLLDDNQPEEALKILKSRPADEQRSAEVKDLKARALRMLGQQQVDLQQFERAVATWGQAVEAAASADLKNEIREAIVETAHTQALRMENTRRDDAILLLETAFGIVSNNRLRDKLADLLMQRGDHEFLEGCKEVERAVPPSVVSVVSQGGDAIRSRDWDRAVDRLEEALRRGARDSAPPFEQVFGRCQKAVKDLKRAAKLGSKTAKEQLDAVKDQVADLDKPDWRDRIGLRLATALTNRAVGKANRAVEMLNAAAEDRQRMLLQMTAFGRLGLSGLPGLSSCAFPDCHRSAEYTITLQTAGGATLPLCSKHADELREPPKSREAIDLIRSAEGDLLRAEELAPHSEYVQRNVSSLHDLMSNLGLERQRGRAAKKAASRARAKAAAAGAQPVAPPAASKRGGKIPGVAIAALVLGILSLAGGTVLAGVPGVICGHVALHRIARSLGRLRGKGVAAVGLVLSYLGLLLFVLLTVGGSD